MFCGDGPVLDRVVTTVGTETTADGVLHQTIGDRVIQIPPAPDNWWPFSEDPTTAQPSAASTSPP